MKRALLGSIMLVAAALILSGCGGGEGNGGSGKGTLVVRVEFPERGADGSRFIPGLAESISIDVTRDGAPLVPQAVIVNPGGGTVTTTINDVPVGPATVTARAWTHADPAQGNMMASGSVDVTIEDGQNSVEIVLAVVIFGNVIDATTREPIEGATITVSESVTTGGKQGAVVGTDLTDGAGDYEVPIVDGTYRVDCEADGYEPGMADDVAPDPDWGSQRVDFALMPVEGTHVVGGVSGRVTDQDMQPIPTAVVQIGAEETNGVFAATTVNPDGTYSITGFSLLDRDGVPIPDFDVTAYANGYAPETQVVVVPADTTVADVNFVLQAGGQGEPIPNCEDPEDWTMTGLWHVKPDAPQIINQFIPGLLIPEGYVALAPDDDSGGALPDGFTPGCAFWYGGDDPGNYVEQHDTQNAEPLDGGLSVSAHAGDLVSPPVVLPAIVGTKGAGRFFAQSEVALMFNSWFEIESVNPHSFDLMTVAISTDDGATFEDVAKLNPEVDPVISEEQIPFGSAGSNKKPVWTLYSLDLSDYAGETVRIRFRFETRDALYNGFRGWVLDNIQIVGPMTAPDVKSTAAVPLRRLQPGEMERIRATSR